MNTGVFETRLETAEGEEPTRILLRDLVFRRPCGERITAPAGTETDYASVPRGLWNVFPRAGKYRKAAAIHDYLYRKTNRNRAVCDLIFWEAVRACGIGSFQSWVLWDRDWETLA